MKDFRCQTCNRLLAKIESAAKVEIKCPRCKTMNLYTEEVYITIEAQEETQVEGEICTDPEIAES